MKKCIFIIVILLAVLMTCSCALGRKKSGLKNNLKTVDMSKYQKTVSVPNNDSRVEENGNGNGSNPNTGITTPAASGSNDQTGMTITDSESKKKPNSGNNNTSGNNGDKENIGTSPTPGAEPGEEKETFSKADSSIRETEGKMETEKYLIYMPTIIETPMTIERTEYGVTIRFPSTSRLEQYVDQLKAVGFVMDAQQSASSFSAHTQDGMYVKFIVTAQESWLAIYDNEQHLNG